MARITLDPGEIFEHYHGSESVTEHISGRLQLQTETEERPLAHGESYKVPPNTRHTLVNVGDEPATVACWHRA